MSAVLKPLVILILIIHWAFWAQWPVGTTNSETLTAQGFSYSGVTNLKINNGFASSDNTQIYASAYGQISSVDHTMVYMMDHLFNIQWNKWFPGLVQHESMRISQDFTNIFLLPYSTTQWTVIKMSTTNGGIIQQVNLLLVTGWQSLQQSNDGVYLYISGIYLLNTVVVMLNASSMSLSFSQTHTTLQVTNLVAFTTGSSQYNLILNTVSLLGSDYQISALDMTQPLLAKSWGMKFSDGCVLLWPSAAPPVLSLIDQTLSLSYQLMIYNSIPMFYAVSLATGALSGSFYEANLGQTGMLAMDMKFSDDASTVFIIIKHNNGFHIINYYPSTTTFSNAKTSTTLEINYVTMVNGYLYFGGQIKSNLNAFITDIPRIGNYGQNSAFTLTSSISTFTLSVGTYSIVADITIIVAQWLGPILSAGSVAFVNPGKFSYFGAFILNII